MFLGLVVALLVIGFSPISEAANIEGKQENYNRKRERTEFYIDSKYVFCNGE